MSELNDGRSALSLLNTRRSLVAAKMCEPGPTPSELEQILTIGLRVPDHTRAEPWRIQVVGGAGRERLVAEQTQLFASARPKDPAKKLEVLNQIVRETPVLLVVTSCLDQSKFEKAPAVEQILSGGALCQNILLAAHALGYVAQWITGWTAYHPRIKSLLGHSPETDILGFIYIGSSCDEAAERPRPALEDIVSHWV